MATTVHRMDERLDKLEVLMKSCQLSGNAYPAEQNDQPLQRTFSLNCRACGRNGHKHQTAFVHLMAIHRGLINVATIIHVTTTTFLIEGTTISTLNMRKETMEWELIHSNPEPPVMFIILDIIIVV